MHLFIRAIIITAIVAGSLAVAVMLTMSRDPAPRKPAEPTAILVDTIPVERVNTSFTVQSQGTVRPRIETLLSAEVSGTVVEMSDAFVAGGIFEPDDVLLRIDPTNYRVAVEKSQALVKQRQIEFDGAQKLRSSGFRAESEYASAAAQLASAKAELTGAQRNLERTAIRLPYAGMVRAKEVDIGQFVSPGARLGTVFATATAEIRLPLTDSDLGFVNLPDAGATGAAGPAVRLTAVRKGVPTSWTGNIVRTEGVVDETSRVTYAIAKIDDPYALQRSGSALPIGTFVSAEIEGASESDVLRVPRAALRGSDQIMVMDADSTLRIRSVGVARTNADWAYLSAGVSEGEQVIMTVLESPVNGMLVRTRDRAVDTAAGSSEGAGG